MLRILPCLAWFFLVLTSSGCSGSLAQVDLGRVVTQGRDGWQHPERVIEALAIRPGDRVAEIGAGSGYWIAALSEAVGPGGRVYAVEVERALADGLRARVERDGLENVEVILGDYDDPRLPEAQVDLAMTCLTYHHIEDRVPYFRRLQTVLSERGRVAHLDDRPDAPAPLSWFQTKGHWTEPERLAAEMREAGYLRSEAFDFLPVQSFQVFVPRREDGAATAALD